ncbi:MAG: 2-octaprenyl-6-methoxyphenol hydroxylase [Accumulibacter sp.]|uniref:FAD-dependent monooxygenase n=1 Tax=Accumulibacter sp. TaxID=2053492 RepID=UPI0011FFE09A|nr:FAD-dependent monooxygenase [Accumulibacter sp.]TLD45909.1 MAG: 2-octaprenyl-6-methoxyphenol hydroxylase [Accumulibacter sp.]
MTEHQQSVDIAIIGAGPVGMTLALALAGGPHRLRLIDVRPRGAWSGDPRALALAHGSRQVLQGLQAWNLDAATAISTIHVSQRTGFGRTRIDASDYGLPALGYVMRYRDLAAALDARLEDSVFLDNCSVQGIRNDDTRALITMRRADETWRITARLVVHAEGTPGHDADVRVCDYHQHAVVAEVRPTAPHGHRAWERFTGDGPIALLPLGHDYSLVFTVPQAKAAELLELDEHAFLAALRTRFADRMDFVACSPRASFPLALRIRRQIAVGRQVWIGNAAQTLHPVSGQGFNLGLRDAWELADTLLGMAGNDAGEAAGLAAYSRRRRIDRSGSAAFTDGIVRVFANDLAPLRCARGLGLLALELLPPLRHFVARRMIWGARAWP